MRHIFEDFMNPIAEGFEEVHLAVEKDTKKAMKEIVEQLDVLSRGGKNRIIHLDATKVKDLKIVASYVSYSLYLFRNISYHGFKALIVKLNPDLQVSELTEEDRKQFMKLKRKGGRWSDYTLIEGVHWEAINSQINDGIEGFMNRFKAVAEKYKPYIQEISKEPIKFSYSRRWNFHVNQNDLLTLYKKCFNEIEFITSPELCCNPNPSFQRDLVWSEEKKRAFIHSILDEIPIGSFYVNRPEKSDPYLTLCEGYGSLLWDGKQRLHALDDFFKGKFAVLVNGKMTYYYENPAFFYHKFSSCMITTYISNFDTLREVIEAYVVINSAQVKHTDEDLKKAIDYLENQAKQDVQ